MAKQAVAQAVGELVSLRGSYQASADPQRKARIRALDTKIDALQAVHLDPEAHPWIGDWKDC